MVENIKFIVGLFVLCGLCFWFGVGFTAYAYKYGRTQKEGVNNEMENL